MDQRVKAFLEYAKEQGFEATEGTVLHRIIMSIVGE